MQSSQGVTMKGMRLIRHLTGLLALCLLAVPFTASAQAIFAYPIDPDEKIISYSITSEMLAAPDRTLHIQVFGDGWVWVQFPAVHDQCR